VWSFFQETILEGGKLLHELSGCIDRCVEFLKVKDSIMDFVKIMYKCSKEKMTIS